MLHRTMENSFSLGLRRSVVWAGTSASLSNDAENYGLSGSDPCAFGCRGWSVSYRPDRQTAGVIATVVALEN